MLQVFNEIQTEPIEAGLSQVVDRIVRQYEDFRVAFQKEAIQNAWDAREDKRHAKCWETRIYQSHGHIVIEDFGTTGMDDEGWRAFTALWKPKKEHLDAGGQGQGKFVLMGASSDHILLPESKSDAILYRCMFLKDGDKGENLRGKKIVISALINNVQSLDHKGTKIWVYNPREEFLKGIEKEEFTRAAASTWWQILQEPFNARIFVFGRRVLLPQIPPTEKSKTLLENKGVRNFGRIKRLVLSLHEKPLPDGFLGVRVQRAQMMILSIPFGASDKEYEDRLSGYITFDEKLEKVLKDIERTDHCGFVWDSPWKEVKRLIEEEIEKFKEEVIPKPEKGVSFNQRLISEVMSKANEILMEHLPEVGHEEGPTVPPILPKSRPDFRIESLSVDKKEIKYNEPMHSRCLIKNETKNKKKATLKVQLKQDGQIITKYAYKFKVRASNKTSLIFPEFVFDRTFKRGKYTIRAMLKEDSDERDTKATSFYLETKRPHIKSGFIKRLNFRFFDNPTVRSTRIVNGSITINANHPDLRNILESFKYKKRLRSRQLLYYFIKIILDEAVSVAIKERFRDGKPLDVDFAINELLIIRDRMYHDVYL